ncbi:hypothetical protein DFJ63DRAFT_139519 [Scheffersomyces coipomensis]|uniref:uncharacterized protein n=1 Tax=Scheffersomyces coipomensis TaxID=1788519 RepID=UPI00315DCC1C
MTLSIPHLDPDLESQLREIVVQKQYVIDKTDNSNRWTSTISPKLVYRLNDIVEISTNEGEQFSQRPEGVDLIRAIQSIQDRIIAHLQDNFPTNPPFTIHRISEILLDSKKEGYDLINNVQILKYFNSISKLILVSTDVSDFPPTTFSEKSIIKSDVEVVEPIITSQASSISIPLVEIPWLKDENDGIKSSDISLDEGDSAHNMSNESPVNDDMIISPPPSDDKQVSSVGNLTETIAPSPIRRRRENEQDLSSSLILDNNENVSKRPRTDSVSKDESISTEDAKENIDESNEKITSNGDMTV